MDRVAQWSWRILASLVLVALLVGVFVAIPLVLVPIILSLIIAATASPLVRFLQRRGWSRARASAAAVGGGFLAIVLLLILTALSLVSGAEQVTTAAVAGAGRLDAASGGHLGTLVGAVQFSGGQIVHTVVSVADEVAATLVVIVLSVLISFYLLRDGGKLWHDVLSHARSDVAPELDAAGARAFEVLGGYMSGTAAVSFVGAFSQLVIMVVLGIDFALPVFVLSFFLCFIPYIGGFISTGIALLLTIALGTTTDVAIMIVWTLVFNIVTGNIVSPLVYGRTVHLHPAVVLVGIPAGAAVAGILGMFMVVPVLGIVSATWRTVLAAMGARSADPGSPFVPDDVGAEAPPSAPLEPVGPTDPPPLATDTAPA
jgi:predicted PurR-regulated permease PerM